MFILSRAALQVSLGVAPTAGAREVRRRPWSERNDIHMFLKQNNAKRKRTFTHEHVERFAAVDGYLWVFRS